MWTPATVGGIAATTCVATLDSARAFLYAASIMLLTRRLAQSG